VPLSPLARAYDVLLLDLDGCVWVGDDPTPGAPEALAAWRATGRAVAFVTNNALVAPEDHVRKLWRLGFRASPGEVVTAGGALQALLFDEHPGATAYVIGAPAVHRHVADAGLRVVNGTSFASRAEVVVVAGHEGFGFEELKVGVQAGWRGAALVGTDRDATYPMPDGPWPGSGAVIAAVETAVGRPVRAVGKPGAPIFATALERAGGGRALVIGDRLDADVAGAAAAGLDAAVVLTGASDAAAVREARAGGVAIAAVGRTLAELVLDGR
jgi:HAD superfamily hydrolase (TIGR01450 family)